MTNSTPTETLHDESTDLRITHADLTLASKLAQKKGLDVETYLKMLIREALARESKAS